MMQATEAAFQAPVSLNEQATDPMSHTPVIAYATLFGRGSSPANPMVDPVSDDRYYDLRGSGYSLSVLAEIMTKLRRLEVGPNAVFLCQKNGPPAGGATLLLCL